MRGSVVPWMLLAALLHAQELRPREYGRAEGLPHQQVRSLVQDDRGYLWVGTGGRICRHDGSTFVAYGDDAVVAERADALVASAGGELWIGGDGPRITHYDPQQNPPFRACELRGRDLGRNVTALALDGQSRLYVATETGLFAATQIGNAVLECAPLRPDPRSTWYGALHCDGRGRLLYAASNLALRRDGDLERSLVLPPANGNLWAIAGVDDDRCLVLGDRSLLEVDFASERCRGLPLPTLGSIRCTCLCIDRRGQRWIGTTGGLLELPAAGGPPRRHLDGTWIRALCADRAGSLWIGTQNGLLRVSALPFATIEAAPATPVQPVRLLPHGDEMLVATANAGLWRVAGHSLEPTAASARLELQTGSATIVDHRGDLWFARPSALMRLRSEDLPRADTAALERFACLPKRLALDRDGNVLCTTADAVLRFTTNAAGQVTSSRLPLPPDLRGVAQPTDDGEGQYYATADAGLVHVGLTGASRMQYDGVPLPVRTVLLDRRGWLWLSVRGRPGLARVLRRDGDDLQLRWLEPSSGVPQRIVAVLIEGSGGELWLAFAEALCRFDPVRETATTWNWPEHAGIASLQDLAVDRDGRVFVATNDRLLLFTPGSQLPTQAPPVLVTSLLGAGAPIALPDGGTTAPPLVSLPADRGDLVITCCAPGGVTGAASVQYRLTPGTAEFGAPLQVPTLQFGRLASGDYRLELRAAAGDGTGTGPITALQIRVLPPFWRRPEFVMATLVLLATSGFLLHRQRVRRLLAMEAVRRQIAADLHDDIGAGLAQVAVLSEVVKQRLPEPRGMLDEIGALARGMRGSLSDIVWAVDPTKDTLGAVVDRLRHIATNLFAASVRLTFDAPPAARLAAKALPPDRRRHLFLLGKEALANAARHAQATAIAVEFALLPAGFRVRIADDGVGFAPTSPPTGHGQGGMRARAAALGARLTTTSSPGRGTTIELLMPME